jgi:excisionase family DNA binding protein
MQITPAPEVGAIPDLPLWSPRQLATLLGVSRRTIWSMVASGRLPQPLRLGGNVVRWERGTLLQVLEEGRRRPAPE